MKIVNNKKSFIYPSEEKAKKISILIGCFFIVDYVLILMVLQTGVGKAGTDYTKK